MPRAHLCTAELQLLPSGPPLSTPTLVAPGLHLVWRYFSGSLDADTMPTVLHTGLVGGFPLGSWQYTGDGALACVSVSATAGAGDPTRQASIPAPAAHIRAPSMPCRHILRPAVMFYRPVSQTASDDPGPCTPPHRVTCRCSCRAATG